MGVVWGGEGGSRENPCLSVRVADYTFPWPALYSLPIALPSHFLETCTDTSSTYLLHKSMPISLVRHDPLYFYDPYPHDPPCTHPVGEYPPSEAQTMPMR